MADQGACEVGTQAHAVAIRLVTEGGKVPSVPMPGHCGGLINERVSGGQHREEASEIVATTGRSARSDGWIEAAEFAQPVFTEGHVGARAKFANREREERIHGAVRSTIDEPLLKALAEMTEHLHQKLGLSLELSGHEQARHAGHISGSTKTSRDLGQPLSVKYHIIIGERDDGARCLLQPAIMRGSQAAPRLACISQIFFCPAAHKRGCRAADRVVVHDYNFIIWVVNAGEGI
jgi:hypothetical protein